jgi:methionyl-tRNA synthetase
VHERYENELANELGNLLSRTTAMLARYRDGLIPDPPSAADEAPLRALAEEVPRRLDAYDISGALEVIWDEVRRLNKYVTDEKPWELAKDVNRAVDLDRVLFTLVDGLRAVAIALSPYLPATSPRILEALHQPVDLAWEGVAYGRTLAADGIEAAAPLFPRLEAPATAA